MPTNKSLATVQSEIESQLPDNFMNLITAAILRPVLHDLTNFASNPLITHAQIATVVINGNTIMVSGLTTVGDEGTGNFYTSIGATSGGVEAIQDLAGTWFNRVSGNQRTVITDDTTEYTDGTYVAGLNPWNKGGLVNGVDFVQSMDIMKGEFPNNVFIAWSWPYPNFSNVKSFPLIKRDVTTLIPWTSYSSISVSYALYWDGPEQHYDVMVEVWFSTATPYNEISIFMKQPFVRAAVNPYKSITTGALYLNHFDLYDNGTQLLCYPVATGSTNFFSNPTLSGAVAGTPGTPPTDSYFDQSDVAGGLTQTIVGTGSTVVDGVTVNYVDVRWQCASPVTEGPIRHRFGADSTTGNPTVFTVPLTTWLNSFYLAVVGGSTTGLFVAIECAAFRANLTSFTEGGGIGGNMLDYVTSTLQKWAFEFVLTKDLTQYFWASIALYPSVGVPMDITLRIGLPFFAHNPALIMRGDKIDVKLLLQALQAIGYVSGSQNLSSLQIGAETFQGSGNLHIKKYAADWA